ncbi:cyclic nucleotide-gated ion channel 1-like [Quercus robur]|uniref:cyclic nucleotide-gated ion channel 1-like n=1 Tax=Quercus robur TaxID=38942 RepID=UPI0021636D62|nr:cyclic nucleotide-gated ion channel 1-like [Quercus robur]XP_050260531.1 cyclic nucleotide-gated ion channel 1-like [Quercus robur]
MSDHQQGNNERNEKKDIEGQLPSKVVEFVSKPLVRSFLGWYEGILVFCRAIALSLDPLFFYVPVINEDKKCIRLNKVLWTIAIVSRSVTDFIYLVHYVVKSVVKSKKSKIRKEHNDESNSKERNIKSRSYFWPFFMLNILVILPIPQVVMSSLFSEMRRTKSSNITILNCVVLLQYGPRVFQIYRPWKKLISASKFNEASLWIKASFNLFLYILAGHVLGAFWYFFSTQRLAACWHKACDQIHSDGVEISFNCDHSFRNLSFLDDFCPIDTPNPSTFDFGIFLEARRSRSLESTGFLPKAFYCFWWGMRNLSSLGSNLQTSSYIWENIFALGISIFGLLLFLYFIGNLQIYLEWRTTKEQKRRKRKKTLKKWMGKHDFDRTTRDKIIDHMAKSYDADDDVHVETLILGLPRELGSVVNCHICLDLLKNLKIIKDSGLAKHQSLLHEICDSLHPIFYNKYCYIVREGDPIDAVFFITDGTVGTYTSNNGEGSDSRHIECLAKGQHLGGELLDLVLKSTSDDISNSKVPVSSKTLKTYTKVEAFALMAHDLKRIWQSNRISKYPSALTCHN